MQIHRAMQVIGDENMYLLLHDYMLHLQWKASLMSYATESAVFRKV